MQSVLLVRPRLVLFQRQPETLQLALSLAEPRVEVVDVVADGILNEARLLQITSFRSAHLMELRNLFMLHTQRLLLHESLGILQQPELKLSLAIVVLDCNLFLTLCFERIHSQHLGLRWRHRKRIKVLE